MDIRQAELNTTLMGVIRGVADYFELDITTATLYGATGHGFLINVDPSIEPGGPYVWNREHFARLARNLGIKMTSLGLFTPQTPSEHRAQVETQLRTALAGDLPCSLIHLEHQLITGYDETGFHTAGPWAWHTEFPPRRLTFGNWEELGDEFGMGFYTFEKIEPATRLTVVRDSLAYAIDLLESPAAHSRPPFAVGLKAYDHWLAGVAEFGASHGNWWNCIVWSECRIRPNLPMGCNLER